MCLAKSQLFGLCIANSWSLFSIVSTSSHTEQMYVVYLTKNTLNTFPAVSGSLKYNHCFLVDDRNA
jgi:hypothetical protein